MRTIKKGSTDKSVTIRIIDSTDGSPEMGVVYNTSGIALWYRREGATVTAITEATLAAVDSAHSDGGIIHLGDGYYRLDLPDAAWATGATHVMIGGTVTGMIVIGQEVQLVDYDPDNGVRLGLTALPNAAADAAGGLAISDAGGLDLDAKLANTNEITAARMGALTDLINGGRLDLIFDDILMDTGTTLDALIKDVPTVAEFEARTLPAADYTIVSDLPVAPDNAGIAAIAGYLDTEIAAILAAVDTEVAAILEDTGTTLPAAITALPTDADVNAACDTAIADAALATAAAVAAIPAGVRKNTAIAHFEFTMTDSTNHALATGLTVTCTRSIDGAAFAAGTLANVVEVGSGVYAVDFLAADLNGDVVTLRAVAAASDDTLVTIKTES